MRKILFFLEMILFLALVTSPHFALYNTKPFLIDFLQTLILTNFFQFRCGETIALWQNIVVPVLKIFGTLLVAKTLVDF